MLEYSAAIRAVIRHIGPVYAVVAHSFGASATLYALGTHPDARVEKLVVNAPPASVSNVIQMYAHMMDLPQRIVSVIYQLSQQRLGQPVSAFALGDIAPNVNIPSLMLHDRDDRLVPFANAAEITKDWAFVTLEATNGLGHRGALRDPATIERFVEFLA